MVFAEMLLKRVVVDVVLMLTCRILSLTDVALFMLFSAMNKEFIVTVESLSAETALWMPLKACGVCLSRLCVTELLMPAQLLFVEQGVLMCENLFVPGAEVAHLLVMQGSDVSVQVRPAETCDLTVRIGTIVTK